MCLLHADTDRIFEHIVFVWLSVQPDPAFSALTLPVEPALQVQAVSTELANGEVEFVGHAEHLET